MAAHGLFDILWLAYYLEEVSAQGVVSIAPTA